MNEFAKPILKGQSCQATAADTYQGMECLKVLHQQVLPFILRRIKSQVIQELPPKIITDVPCSLSKQQSILYQQILGRSGMKEALEIVDKSILGALSDDSNIGGGHVFASLLQLRLICTHPLLHRLFSDEDSSLSFARLESSGKLLALHDLLCHSGITEPGTIAADNDESCYQVFDADGSDDDYLQNDNSYTFSGNTSERVGGVSKFLVFAQFTQSLDLIERLLFEPHMPTLRYLRLDGSIPENQRSAIVDQFNQDIGIQVLILTTKAGGLGLNLTGEVTLCFVLAAPSMCTLIMDLFFIVIAGADKVIFLESDWNPFVDLQAMDRAHRIGQTKTVNVYRLVTTGTIEEKIMELQRRKMATSDAVVNSDNSTIYSNGTDKLLDIFTCRSGDRGSMTDDNVLSYLDDNVCIKEYSSLTVDGFLLSMKK
jgi:TATA-binding protein-associated factor